MHSENGHCLSIDPGLHNLLTCYDNEGRSFILGRKYLEITRKYVKEISRVQSQWAKQQVKKGVKYPKSSKHVKCLYVKKRNCIKDYLHKVTGYIARYCEEHEIHTVVIGDLKGIREFRNIGNKNNQKLHGLPYEQIYGMLKYKLEMRGITFVKQKESYSSQCSPVSEDVSKKSAEKGNRKNRGLYVEKTGQIYNADAVGAFNILRKNNAVTGRKIEMPISGLKQIEVIKVAV
ncbi:MAG: transposase, partial [Oscillospiraceae bacterium]|nr:transposase [Candidatus Limimonas coprohippi]